MGIPTPCHRRGQNKRNWWCKDSPCLHEYETAASMRSLMNYIKTEAATIKNAQVLDLTMPFTKEECIGDRDCFRRNDVHFSPMSADEMEKAVMNAFRRLYKVQ